MSCKLISTANFFVAHAKKCSTYCFEYVCAFFSHARLEFLVSVSFRRHASFVRRSKRSRRERTSAKNGRLFGDCAVQSFEYNSHEVMAFGAFDLLEGLDVLLLRPVHDREDLCHEVRFIARPLTAGAVIQRFHPSSFGCWVPGSSLEAQCNPVPYQIDP